MLKMSGKMDGSLTRRSIRAIGRNLTQRTAWRANLLCGGEQTGASDIGA